MTTNANPFRTLHTATYGLRDKDGNEMPVFYIGETNSDNDGYVKSFFSNNMDNTSLLYLTNDTYWKPLCLITGGAAQEHTHVRTQHLHHQLHIWGLHLWKQNKQLRRTGGICAPDLLRPARPMLLCAEADLNF